MKYHPNMLAGMEGDATTKNGALQRLLADETQRLH